MKYIKYLMLLIIVLLFIVVLKYHRDNIVYININTNEIYEINSIKKNIKHNKIKKYFDNNNDTYKIKLYNK